MADYLSRLYDIPEEYIRAQAMEEQNRARLEQADTSPAALVEAAMRGPKTGIILPIIWNPDVGPDWFPKTAFASALESISRTKRAFKYMVEDMHSILGKINTHGSQEWENVRKKMIEEIENVVKNYENTKGEIEKHFKIGELSANLQEHFSRRVIPFVVKFHEIEDIGTSEAINRNIKDVRSYLTASYYSTFNPFDPVKVFNIDQQSKEKAVSQMINLFSQNEHAAYNFSELSIVGYLAWLILGDDADAMNEIGKYVIKYEDILRNTKYQPLDVHSTMKFELANAISSFVLVRNIVENAAVKNGIEKKNVDKVFTEIMRKSEECISKNDPNTCKNVFVFQGKKGVVDISKDIYGLLGAENSVNVVKTLGQAYKENIIPIQFVGGVIDELERDNNLIMMYLRRRLEEYFKPEDFGNNEEIRNDIIGLYLKGYNDFSDKKLEEAKAEVYMKLRVQRKEDIQNLYRGGRGGGGSSDKDLIAYNHYSGPGGNIVYTSAIVDKQNEFAIFLNEAGPSEGIDFSVNSAINPQLFIESSNGISITPYGLAYFGMQSRHGSNKEQITNLKSKMFKDPNIAYKFWLLRDGENIYSQNLSAQTTHSVMRLSFISQNPATGIIKNFYSGKDDKDVFDNEALQDARDFLNKIGVNLKSSEKISDVLGKYFKNVFPQNIFMTVIARSQNNDGWHIKSQIEDVNAFLKRATLVKPEEISPSLRHFGYIIGKTMENIYNPNRYIYYFKDGRDYIVFNLVKGQNETFYLSAHKITYGEFEKIDNIYKSIKSVFKDSNDKPTGFKKNIDSVANGIFNMWNSGGYKVNAIKNIFKEYGLITNEGTSLDNIKNLILTEPGLALDFIKNLQKLFDLSDKDLKKVIDSKEFTNFNPAKESFEMNVKKHLNETFKNNLRKLSENSTELRKMIWPHIQASYVNSTLYTKTSGVPEGVGRASLFGTIRFLEKNKYYCSEENFYNITQEVDGVKIPTSLCLGKTKGGNYVITFVYTYRENRLIADVILNDDNTITYKYRIDEITKQQE